MKAAFFDLDGTLINGYTWSALKNYHLIHRYRRVLLWLFLGIHYPLYPLVKIGLLSRGFFYKAWGKNMAWLVKNVSIKKSEKIWDWIIDNEFMNKIRPEMEKQLYFHKNQGHHIVFVSGTFQPLLERLAKKLDVQAALGTGLEKRDGIYTGRIVPPLNIGQAKVQMIKSYLNQLNSKVDLEGSYMYSDSIVDLPVLEMVGNPVAVYPEHELMTHALNSSWKIVGMSEI